jgi:hypothetical protein
MVDGLTDYLLSVAMRTGSHTVVLGAYPDLTVGRAWLPRLASLTAAFVGIVGPALAGVEPRQVRLTAAPAPIPGGTETVLAVFGPHAAVALCVRPGHRGGVDFVLTHDPNLVHAVARMLMWRLDTVHRAMDPPIVDPEATPATVAS